MEMKDESPRLMVEETKAGYPPISVEQPQLHDIVDDPIKVCGIGTGFEGVIVARVRDASGTEIARKPGIRAGGTGTWGNFQAQIPLHSRPSSAQGTLEVFDAVGVGGEIEAGKVVVPIVFGTNLIQDYFGFEQYEVQNDDTLRTIANRIYGDANLWTRLFEANRNQIIDPNRIFAGQVLRVPVGTGPPDED